MLKHKYINKIIKNFYYIYYKRINTLVVLCNSNKQNSKENIKQDLKCQTHPSEWSKIKDKAITCWDNSLQ